jgi:hypothetical protein
MSVASFPSPNHPTIASTHHGRSDAIDFARSRSNMIGNARLVPDGMAVDGAQERSDSKM